MCVQPCEFLASVPCFVPPIVMWELKSALQARSRSDQEQERRSRREKDGDDEASSVSASFSLASSTSGFDATPRGKVGLRPSSTDSPIGTKVINDPYPFSICPALLWADDSKLCPQPRRLQALVCGPSNDRKDRYCQLSAPSPSHLHPPPSPKDRNVPLLFFAPVSVVTPRRDSQFPSNTLSSGTELE